MQKKPSHIGINIGATRESVAEARKTIVEILASDAEEETKRAALTALSTLCAVTHTNLTGCNVEQKF